MMMENVYGVGLIRVVKRCGMEMWCGIEASTKAPEPVVGETQNELFLW